MREAATLTLAEFLLARIAEDEAMTIRLECACLDGAPQRPDCPDRIANDCEAKRGMVATLTEMDGCPENIVGSYAYSLLCAMALPYADHEHYREEWRP